MIKDKEEKQISIHNVYLPFWGEDHRHRRVSVGTILELILKELSVEIDHVDSVPAYHILKKVKTASKPKEKK